MPNPAQNVFETITSKIITQLEQGVRLWHKPWSIDGMSAAFQMPLNGVTGNRYNGINIPLLWQAAEEHGFTTPEYATYKQWEAKGEQVSKGSKGNMIIYYGAMDRKNEDDEAYKVRFANVSYVFNRCQLNSYEPGEIIIKDTKPIIERIEKAEVFLQNTGARIYNDGGNRAYYSRLKDDIHLPFLESFVDTPTRTATEGYYAIALHEVTHWSGHPLRLDRQFGKKFGDRSYAFEELVAEMGSAFLCNTLEITDEPREDHAQYLDNWLQVLKEDSKAIVTAASHASKACDYVWGLQPKNNPT